MHARMSRKVIAGLSLGLMWVACARWAGAETASPDAEAMKRLEQQASEEQKLREEVKLQAQSHLETGRRLFKAFEYKAAQAELLRAVNLDQSNQEARTLLIQVNDILNQRQDRIQAAVQSLAQAQRVAVQERLVLLDSRLDWGNRYTAKATEDPELSLADRIRQYQLALDAFERARELVKWMPVGVNVDEQQHQAERMISETRKSIKALEVQLVEEDKQRAMELSQSRATVEREQEQRRVAMQIDEVKALFEIGEYERAEALAGKILETDPTNAEAHAIQITSRDRKHIKRQKWIQEEYDEEFLRQRELADRNTIPHQDYLIYPDNWPEIQQRTGDSGKSRIDEPWKIEVQRKLSRRVSFEFVDTPLQEALTFLQTLSKVNIILDPRAATAGAAQLKITLRVTDMDMETALKWILRLAELDYDLRGQAVYISTRSNLATNVELEIYDVRDLTTTINDFPAPRIELSSNTQQGGAGVTFVTPTTAPTLAAPDLAQLIRERLLPGDFVDATTSIEEQGGKLVVMQRPEVHAKIRRILQSFRETQAVQVLTQVRFIDALDGFLEQIGVNFTGLDSVPGTAAIPQAITDPYKWNPSKYALYPMGGGPGLPTDAGGNAIIPANGIPLFDASHDSNPATAAYDWLIHPRLDPNLTPGVPYTGNAGAPVGFRKQIGKGQLLQSITENVVRNLAGSGPLGTALTGQPIGNQGLVLQFRFLHSIQANAVLQAVRKDQTTDVLIATKLMQFNNQRAHLLVANQQSFIYDYDISGSAWDPIIRSLTTGVVLEVKPTVSHDRKYITLDLRPGVAELISPIRVMNIVGVGLQAAVYPIDLPIELPEIELRFVNTTVTVPDNGTLLFSGLINDRKFDGKTGVPFFSDLPVIGRLFSTNVKQRERRNLLILVNSRVVLFDEEEAKL